MMRVLAALLLWIALPGIPIPAQQKTAPSREHRDFVYERVTLKRVVNADTLRLKIEIAPGLVLTDQRCRLVRVNMPEISTPEGLAAKEKLSTFLRGKKLRLRRVATDRYGRWLIELEADGKNVSDWLRALKAKS